MRGKLLTRHKACGLAIALVATSSLSLLTPSFASEDSSLAGLVAKSTGLSVVVKAETAPTLALTAADLTVNGDTITGFSASGLAKINAITVTGTSIKFPADLTATKIGKEAFSKKFNNKKVKIELPDNIVEIGEAAFASNSVITAVTFGTNPANSKLKTIGTKAFYEAGLVENPQFPNGLEELGEASFAKNKLTSIKLPDDIKRIHGHVFAYNEITEFDFGAYKNAKGRRWFRSTELVEGIPAGILRNNKLQKVNLPTAAGIWSVGANAFANNDIRELTLPSNFTVMYSNAFFNNPKLTKLVFETKDDGKGNKIGIGQIDRSSFQGCSIEGHLEFPDKFNEMGVDSFAGNKITSVSFGKESPLNGPIVGGRSMAGNPLVSIDGFDTKRFEDYAFQDTKNLKNISFDYSSPRPNFTSIEPYAFKNGLLKSIKLPSYINNVYDSAFNENTGWTEGTNKVALYRVASDGATYVTDNEFIDSGAKTYVVNPVLVKFVAKDQYGNVVTLSSIEVERTRTIKGASEAKTVTSTAVNLADFKLGDKIKFTIPAAPEGYEIAESPVSNSAITKTADGNYEVTLDPTNAEVVKEVAYGDGYKVGYKETVIEIGYKNLSPEPPKPEVKPENPSTPATPGAIQPEKPSTPTTPGAITPENPSTPATPEAIKPVEPAKPSEPVTPSTPGNPTTPNTPVVPANPTEPTTPVNPTTPTTTIPTENPPTNVPFTPERIVNPNLIPEGNPVFNIVDEDGTSLGNAEVNKDDGTYTFVKDKRTPKGVAKIRKDNTLEVVKVFDGKTPQGKLPRLPKTGGSSEEGLVLLGVAMLGLGAFFRRKIK